MNAFILVAYATKGGSTEQVALDVAGRLSAHGLVADVRAADNVTSLDDYDGVVLGSSIYMGRLHGDARSFLRRYRAELSERPLAVFAMGPRTLEPGDVAGSEKQLAAGLAKEPELEPFATTVFGGVFDPDAHHFPLNRMPASDARDWVAIRRWADEVATHFARHEVAA